MAPTETDVVCGSLVAVVVVVAVYRFTDRRSQGPLPHHFSLDYLELAKKSPDSGVSDQGGSARGVSARAQATAREMIFQNHEKLVMRSL